MVILLRMQGSGREGKEARVQGSEGSEGAEERRKQCYRQ